MFRKSPEECKVCILVLVGQLEMLLTLFFKEFLLLLLLLLCLLVGLVTFVQFLQIFCDGNAENKK